MSDTVYLVSFDTDRIKEYIFATTDLKKIRGASTLLEFLNQEKTLQVIKNTCSAAGFDIPDEKIVTGGGAAMAIVPTEELAQHVKVAVERLYRMETITGSITGTCLEIPAADLETPNFRHHVAQLSAKLRSAKDSKGHQPLFPLTAYTRPCSACARHPGIKLDPYDSAQALCQSCWKKHEWNLTGKNHFREGLHDHISDQQREYAAWLDMKFPEDFNDIGDTSRPTGYLGFILADGNGIGSLLEDMPSFGAYHNFAVQLDQIVRRVTYRALLNGLRPRQGIAPFEILLMGGDDLMVVVAADAALEVTLKIVEDFEVEANALAYSPEVGLPKEVHLSMSAGVVIAHDSFPIKAMHDLASDLLKSAKRASPQLGNKGTIDFMVVTGAATAGLEVVRDKVLTDSSFAVAPTGSDKFILTERPYTTCQLRKLLNHIRRFKQQKFPSKTLHTLYEAMFQSKVQAQFNTIAALARAKSEHRELVFNFFDELGVSRRLVPWRENQNKEFSSPLGDLVEIYPFVCKRGDYAE